MSTIRLGLIGAGRWGRNYIRTVDAVSDATLAVIASRNPATDALMSEGCKRVTDWRDVLSNGGIDGLILAVPPGLHPEIIEAASVRELPVLVEKPLAMGRAAADHIRALHASRRLRLLVDHTHLFHPCFKALEDLVSRIGPIRGIRASAGAQGPYRREWPVLWDWGPHDVAMSLSLLPGTVCVEAADVMARQVIDGVTAERLHLTLRLGEGVIADLTFGTLDERHRRFAVDFDDATLVYGDHRAGPLVRMKPGADHMSDDAEPVTVPSDALPLTQALKRFLEMISEDKFDDESLILGLKVVDCLAACEEKLTS